MDELNFTQISEEFLAKNKESNEKRINFFNEVFAKVKKGNKESVDALKVIDKNYNEKTKSEKENLEILKAQLAQNNQELKAGLDNYYANYNIETETKKLEDSKEKGVQPKILIYRKETHDVSFKYDRLLKEEKETLKAKQDAYDDFEKTYKGKISDLEKRRRYELNKSKSVTLNSTDELQKNLLNTNNHSEIKSINRQIQEIRKVGLQNEKKIKLNYINLIKKEDINYEHGKHQFELDLNEIRKEYSIKKEELDTEKKQANQRYQIELDKYDFGSRRALNNLNQKMIAKKNSLIMSIREKNKELSLDYQKMQRGNIKYRHTITNDFIDVMDKNYQSITKTIDLSNTIVDNNYISSIYFYKQYLDNILDNLFKMIDVLHSEYVNNVINNEYDNLKLIVNAKYNYDTLCKKDYKQFISRLENLYEDFKKEVTQNDKEYEMKLKDILEETHKMISNIFEKIKILWASESDINNYHNNFKNELNKFIQEIKEYEDLTYTKEYNGFYFINSKIQEYNDALSATEKENKEVSLIHDNTNDQIDEEVNKYNEEKGKEALEIVSKKENNINKIMFDYQTNINNINLTLENNLKNIEDNAIKDIKNIELDFNTQMNLLK